MSREKDIIELMKRYDPGCETVQAEEQTFAKMAKVIL